MHRLLVDAAERRPDQLALRCVDRDRGLTFAEAVAAGDAMAGALAALGVGKGDRVTIFARNGLDYLVVMLGCWRLGAIAALVNVKLADDLEYYLGDHAPVVVAYDLDMAGPARRAASATASVRHLVCMDGAQEGAHSLPELMAARLAPPPDPLDEDAVAHLSYTSGTTGRPKGACLAHEPTVRAARCIGERLRLTADDVSFGATALSSSYQLVGNLLPQFAAGATVHVMAGWAQAAGWAALERTGTTVFVANPTLLQDVLAESRVRGRAPARLRFGMSGGGPVPPALKAAWRDELGLPLVESYGQSELGGFMALGTPDIRPDGRLMPVGRPLPDKEVRILDEHDRPLPPGRIGEIALRGGCMTGYWGRPEKTAETLRNGWLHSGDLGFMDVEGAVTLRGRRAELFHVDGKAWFPRDAEEALTRQPGVRQAAVVGVADDALGARPVAFVTAGPGERLDPAALKAAIARASACDYAHLDVIVVQDLPMTPTGKVAKAELAARRTNVSPGFEV